MPNRIKSLKEFYPYYLKEHQHPTSRLLHFIGTGIVVFLFLVAVFTGNYTLFLFVPLVGYGFAWIGHFYYEKNKPATFQYPFYSLASDFLLFFDILRKKEKINPKNT